MSAQFALINGWEIVALLAIVLLFFGAKKLPELAGGLGRSIREFRKSSNETQLKKENGID